MSKIPFLPGAWTPSFFRRHADDEREDTSMGRKPARQQSGFWMGTVGIPNASSTVCGTPHVPKRYPLGRISGAPASGFWQRCEGAAAADRCTAARRWPPVCYLGSPFHRGGGAGPPTPLTRRSSGSSDRCPGMPIHHLAADPQVRTSGSVCSRCCFRRHISYAAHRTVAKTSCGSWA